MENIDVFIMDPTFIDLLVYDLWLQGFSENEAAQRRKCDEKFKNFGASHAIITSDTQDQFRLFYMLERFLQSPPMLAKQMLLQISPDVQDILIERHFDKEVVRELLGKKLTGRVRKDLDDVSEKTNIPLKSCRRQMLDHWTVGSVEGSTADVGDTGAEFDRGFLQELRDLKVFVNDKEIVDEHRSLVCNDIAKRFTKKLAKSVENNFKNLCRGLLTIAAGLIHSKEVKDVLSDFVEKFIESCKQQEWDANETDIFLGSLVDTCGKLDSLHSYFDRNLGSLLYRSNLERLIPVYSRYMTVCQKCIVRMYHD
ncbi:hypothetical protein pdam_00006525 [Pocillopora damicornis]|uniref:Acidic fibroblast growth factor intracellular-binding protein n=1 Tax=Pocillopora damicornis TaxID=46731 RepID=A0A3M6THQ8_POCDA|nr:hypothetical protein pdam_00006525 [Pocillopora damicornis]